MSRFSLGNDLKLCKTVWECRERSKSNCVRIEGADPKLHKTFFSLIFVLLFVSHIHTSQSSLSCINACLFVFVSSSQYFRETILNEIRKARELYTGLELAAELSRIQQRLDNVECLSVDVVINLLLTYRDIQVQLSGVDFLNTNILLSFVKLCVLPLGISTRGTVVQWSLFIMYWVLVHPPPLFVPCLKRVISASPLGHFYSHWLPLINTQCKPKLCAWDKDFTYL